MAAAGISSFTGKHQELPLSPDNISDNSSYNSTCFNFDTTVPTILSQFVLAMIILGLNIMVVTVICLNKSRTFHKPAFVYIISLASADMILALTLVCISVLSTVQAQLSASTWINLTACTSVCFNASVNFLFVIAIDRLCYIAYNQRYMKIMNSRKALLVVVGCWFVAILPVLPLFFWDVGSCAEYCSCYIDQFLDCPHVSCSSVVKGFTKNFLFGLFFYFLTMLVSINGIYATLFWKVRQQSKRVRNHSNQSSKGRSSRMKREFKLAQTLALVVICFFLCWTPLMFLYVIDYASSDDFFIKPTIAQAIMTPPIFNSILNPLIYAARIPILKKYFWCCGCSVRPESSDKQNRKTSSTSSKRSNKKGKKSMETANSTAFKRIFRESASNCSSSQIPSKLVMEYRQQGRDYSCSSEQFTQRGITADTTTMQVENSPERISMLNGNKSANNAIEINKMRDSIVIVDVTPLQQSVAPNV